MKVIFQADADFNQHIVDGVRRRKPSIDFKNSTEAGLDGLADEDVLRVAASEGRVVVSHDFKTMPLEFGGFIVDHHCPGVFLVQQHVPVAVVIDEIELVWEASDGSEWVDLIAQLPL